MALQIDTENKMIGGVCAGIANYANIDPAIVRLAFVLGFIAWGIGPVIYLILWIIMKKNKQQSE